MPSSSSSPSAPCSHSPAGLFPSPGLASLCFLSTSTAFLECCSFLLPVSSSCNARCPPSSSPTRLLLWVSFAQLFLLLLVSSPPEALNPFGSSSLVLLCCFFLAPLLPILLLGNWDNAPASFQFIIVIVFTAIQFLSLQHHFSLHSHPYFSMFIISIVIHLFLPSVLMLSVSFPTAFSCIVLLSSSRSVRLRCFPSTLILTSWLSTGFTCLVTFLFIVVIVIIIHLSFTSPALFLILIFLFIFPLVSILISPATTLLSSSAFYLLATAHVSCMSTLGETLQLRPSCLPLSTLGVRLSCFILLIFQLSAKRHPVCILFCGVHHCSLVLTLNVAVHPSAFSLFDVPRAPPLTMLDIPLLH